MPWSRIMLRWNCTNASRTLIIERPSCRATIDIDLCWTNSEWISACCAVTYVFRFAFSDNGTKSFLFGRARQPIAKP